MVFHIFNCDCVRFGIDLLFIRIYDRNRFSISSRCVQYIKRIERISFAIVFPCSLCADQGVDSLN